MTITFYALFVVVMLFGNIPVAHAFSSFYLADPGFQIFAFIQVPSGLIAAKILAEYAFLRLDRKTSFSGALFPALIRAALVAVGWAVFLTILLIFLLGGLFTQNTTHPLIIKFGIAYFAGTYLWLGWHSTISALKPLCTSTDKSWKILAFLANLLCYGACYVVLYFRLT